MTARISLFAALLALGACREQTPPAPTPEESAQLNEMEDSLNALSENAEGPEANASGPSD